MADQGCCPSDTNIPRRFARPKSFQLRLGLSQIQNMPKVVTDIDEVELAKQLESLEEANREVDGDDDNDEDAPPRVCT